MADEIEWAKSRRLPGGGRGRRHGRRAGAADPVDVFARIFGGYERAKTRAGLLDFEDLRAGTVDLSRPTRRRPELVAPQGLVQRRRVPGHEPLEERLLDCGRSGSREISVVGDQDQTIYTFTGATSGVPDDVLSAHPGRRGHPRKLPSSRRSSNSRTGWRRPDGTSAAARRAGGARSQRSLRNASRPPKRSRSSAWIAELLGEGIAPSEVAGLVRINAQLPRSRGALTRAGIAYSFRGQRFYDHREVPNATDLARRSGDSRRPARPRRGGARLLGQARSTTGARRRASRRRGSGSDASLELLRGNPRARGRGRRRPQSRDPMPSPSSIGARRRARRLERGRQPAHLPPGQGPRVGRGRPAGARGGPPADPPGTRTTGSPRSGGCSTSGSRGRGATSRSRGRPSARPAAESRAASPAASSRTCGRGRRAVTRDRELPAPAAARRPALCRAATCPAHGRAAGWRTVEPARMPSRLRRRSRRDARGDRRGQSARAPPPSRGSRASVRPRSTPTATISSGSSGPTRPAPNWGGRSRSGAGGRLRPRSRVLASVEDSCASPRRRQFSTMSRRRSPRPPRPGRSSSPRRGPGSSGRARPRGPG